MPTDDSDDRRARRRASQQIFDELVTDYPSVPGVTRRVMFGSEGLRYDGTFFAFIGGDGDLVVKLPADRAAHLVEAGRATRMRNGRREMREWIGLPWIPVTPAAGGRSSTRPSTTPSREDRPGQGVRKNSPRLKATLPHPQDNPGPSRSTRCAEPPTGLR